MFVPKYTQLQTVNLRRINTNPAKPISVKSLGHRCGTGQRPSDAQVSILKEKIFRELGSF